MSRKKSVHRRNQAIAQTLESRVLFDLTPITFAPSVSFVAGTSPVAMVTADFTGDGDLDLAVADKATDKVNIFLGNGNGTFSVGQVLSLSAPPTAIITGDFTDNGQTDIAVATTATANDSNTAVDVFVNNGNANFSLGKITTVETNATPGEPVALAAGDFNNTSNMGLAVTGYSSQSVYILNGNGNGTFAAPIPYTSDQYPTAIAEADFDDDGYPDLAVTSTSVNTVAGQTNNGSATNQVSLILDDSRGDFSGGPNIAITTNGTPDGVTAANLTTASTPGLLVACTDGTVDVITNTGGSFAVSAVATVAGGTGSVAAGDFNLDGNTDFVSANGGGLNSSNSVTVVPGLGDGALSSSSTLGTGAGPVAVVVGDFNNDGKPDIATADSLDGTVSILLNTTALTQIGTSVSLQSSDTSVPAGTTVTFTATVKGASVSPLAGESVPTGTVDFYNGSTLLDATTLPAGSDQAQFSTSSLIVGTQQIHATYAGDTAYLGSSSPHINQVILPTATEGPDLVGTLISSTLPATVAPGETGSVKIQVTNQGNTPAVGSITNTVYLSLDESVEPGDPQLTVRGALARANLRLAPNKSITLTGIVTIPQDAPLATYQLLVALNSTGSLPESVTTNNTVFSPAMYAVADVFGTVAGRSGVVLNVDDENGTPATFRLTGPGGGAVNIGDDGVQVLLRGTSAASSLLVTSPRDAASFDATDLSAEGAIGNIRAGTMSVSGDISLSGGAASIMLASAGNSGAPANITLGAGSATAISITSVPGANLNAAGGIKSIAVGSWGDGTITAGWIGTLRSTQQFTAGLSLSGAGAPGGTALSSATIGGTASGGWTVSGNIGRITAASTAPTADGWSLNDNGALKSLSLDSTFYGNVFATSIGSVQIRGDLFGGDIAADSSLGSIVVDGNLADAKVLAATTAAGTLGTLRVTGSATDSLVAAGAGNGTESSIVLSNAGAIKSITVLGSVDTASKFLAAVLPKRAVLGGVAVTPATDPHFQV